MESRKEKHEKPLCCSDSSCESNTQEKQEAVSCCAPPLRGKKWLLVKNVIFIVIVLLAVGVAAYSIWKKRQLNKACATPCISLESLNSISKVSQDKDFLFLALPGQDEGIPQNVSEIIARASKRISQEGKRVAVHKMERDASDYKKLVNGFKIEAFPAILSMSKGCGVDVVTGNITEEKLLNSFRIASKPRLKPCCPSK